MSRLSFRLAGCLLVTQSGHQRIGRGCPHDQRAGASAVIRPAGLQHWPVSTMKVSKKRLAGFSFNEAGDAELTRTSANRPNDARSLECYARRHSLKPN